MINIRRQLARIKRRLFTKAFHKDPQYPAYWFDQLLGSQASFVVQIGSNDGKTGDPLYKLLQKNKQWEALLVEPVPYVFERLKANYPDQSRFICANTAINDGTTLPFYWVDPLAKEHLPKLPYWFDQLGGFDKEHILKHFDGQLAPYLRSTAIKGTTLDQLLHEHQVSQINILHIDTEGYDWQVLLQLNLERFQPEFIMYEYNHLTPVDVEAARSFLEDYELFDIGIDILAIRKTVDEGFRSRVRQQLRFK